MEALDVIRRLHQHRMWVNAQLLSAAETLSNDDLQRTFAIGQGTLWRSLVHMYAAEWVWLATLGGDEAPVLPGDRADDLPGNQQGEGGLKSLAELRSSWEQLDDRWRAYLAQLAESELNESVFKVSSLQRARFSTKRLDILLHVCTHAHYTAAQVMNMLRQVGAASLPDPMLITMARQEAAAR